MDLQEFAAMLTDRQYNYPQFSTEEIKLAEENGFVIVYGISDDLVELDGAIYDEGDCFEGGELYIPLTPDNSIEESADDPEHFKLVVNWCKDRDKDGRIITWTYDVPIEHADFMIYEDGEPYCRGFVFSVNTDELIIKKNKQNIMLRSATENDLEEIYNLIQSVGREMERENNELFAYSKNVNTYLHMIKTGVCAVATENGKIIASLLTRPEDNKDGVFTLSDIPEKFMPNTIEFVTSQVAKEYRGNKLEQQLINFVLSELDKSEFYKYALCTVCPDNKPSLKSVENSGFTIHAKGKLYGEKTRYVLVKRL